ncbi:hypothetical protein X975_16743, partial [Stegodyphus mimosarum]
MVWLKLLKLFLLNLILNIFFLCACFMASFQVTFKRLFYA